jgi:hypothetical protein
MAAAVAVFGWMPSAYAAPAHLYSVAFDTSAGANYTGAGMTRADGEYSVVGNTNCTWAFHSPSVIYSPVWLTSATGAWMEMGTGTGHQCGGYRYWYAVQGISDTSWQALWTHPFVTTATRTFDFHRLSGTWYWYLDGTPEASFGSNLIGSYVSAGLETYDNANIAPERHDTSLRYELNDNLTDISWSGRDNNTNYPGVPAAPMCGHWDSDTQWRFSENGGRPPGC